MGPIKSLFQKAISKLLQAAQNKEKGISVEQRVHELNEYIEPKFTNMQQRIAQDYQSSMHELYVTSFHNLPEFNSKGINNKLSAQAVKFLGIIDQLQKHDELSAFALMLYLLLDTKINFSHEMLLEEMSNRIIKWQLSDNLPSDKGAHLILECSRSWPIYRNPDSNKLFSAGFPMVFTRYLKEFPDEAICLLKDYSWVIQHRFDEWEYVQLLTSVKELIPNYYIEALLSYIQATGYKNSEHLNEAFDLLVPIFLDKVSHKNIDLENVCQSIIEYGEINESWYSMAINCLWEIESEKQDYDRNSLRNCFYIMKNSRKKEIYFAEIIEHAKSILNHHANLYFANPELMRKEMHEFLYSLSLALGNSSVSFQNRKNKEVIYWHKELVEELISEYSCLLDDFFVRNLGIYLELFLCLMCCNQDDWLIRKMVLKAQAKFIVELEYIVKQAPENLIRVMGGLIVGSSLRWNYKSEISEGIFSHLMVIDSKIALLAIANELKGDRNDREGRWTPVDIGINPIYKGMERGQDYCI